MNDENIVQYSFSEGEATLIKYSGTDTAVYLPLSVQGFALTEIGQGAFAGEQSSEYMVKRKHVWLEEGDGSPIQEMVIPDTVRAIGIGAFARCKALRNVMLPANLTKLPDYLFSECRALLPLALPDSIEEIGAYAFQNCRSITELTLPKRLQKIGNYAFYNCRGLRRLVVPENVSAFGTGTFKNCECLEYIALAGHTSLQNIVADIHHAFTVSMQYANDKGETVEAMLFFTEEACEYIEDYPARQFHQVNYGTGHLYRQCISNTDIDFQRYDQIFTVAMREEPFEQVVTIAKYRLCSPYCLPVEKRKVYEKFFSGNLLKALALLLSNDDIKTVETLANAGVFTAENIDGAIDLAISRKKAAFASFLMDYRHKNIVKAKKSFEL